MKIAFQPGASDWGNLKQGLCFSSPISATANTSFSSVLKYSRSNQKSGDGMWVCVIQRTWLAALSASIWIHAGPAGNAKKGPSGSSVPSVAQAAPANKLDTAHIHKTYLEGEFDAAIELIEDALKYGGPFSHQDSIFIFKHLGVMHTAKYETREKGKRYLMELLNIEPTAKIMDMYASDMIYMIFKNIRDEFETRNPHRFKQLGDGSRPVPENPPPKKKSGYAWVGWTVGAASIVGGTVLAMHLLEAAESPKSRERTSND